MHRMLPGPVGPLECLLEPAKGSRRGVALVCHPHPLHGGTLHNKVTYTLARLLHRHGYDALRFNYRGVGQSAGQWAEGEGEYADAAALLAWLHDYAPGEPICCAGFSFGAYIALRLAHAQRFQGLVTVAPAVTQPGFAELRNPQCPWVLVIDDADDVIDPAASLAWQAALTAPHEAIITEGAGHFFHGRLPELSQRIVTALEILDVVKPLAGHN